MKKLLILLWWVSAEALCFSQGIEVANPVQSDSLPIPLTESSGDDISFQAELVPITPSPQGTYALTGTASFLLSGNTLTFEIDIRLEGNYGSTAQIVGRSSLFAFDLGSPEIFLHSPGPWPNGYDGATVYRGTVEITEREIRLLLSGQSVLRLAQANLRGRICRFPLVPGCDCDGDGVLNKDDLCPNTPLGVRVNACGCSIAQLVPCNGPWRNHHEYVQEVKEQAHRFWREHRISMHERNAIVKDAEKSDCGKPSPGPIPGPITGPGSPPGRL